MAIYNNGFPVTYPQMYQYQQPVAQQPQGQQSGLIWIQGEQAAKSYLVAPNNTVALFDSEAQSIYLKSADASGMPSIKVLDYTIRDSVKNGSNLRFTATDDNLSTYATKSEIKAVFERITALQMQVDDLAKQKEGKKDE